MKTRENSQRTERGKVTSLTRESFEKQIQDVNEIRLIKVLKVLDSNHRPKE